MVGIAGIWFQSVALGASVQDFEPWPDKQAALRLLPVPDDSPVRHGSNWHRQFHTPRDKAADNRGRVKGVHTSIDNRRGAKSRAA